MSEDQGEKTEQATDAKREEFRKQGQVAHTRELGSALLFLAIAGSVWFFGRFYMSNIQELFNKTFGADMVMSIRKGNPFELVQFAATKAFILMLPISVVAAVIGVVSTVAQIGFMQVEDAFSPKFEKLNPIDGFSRIVSLRALVEGLKAFLKLGAVGIVLWLLLKGEAAKAPYLVTYSIEQILEYIGTVVVKLMMGVGLVMTALAAADYFFQRWDLEKKMMMTKQEVKEEHKSREGDPMIKSRIRRIQREMANKRMMNDIPKASVVITNPTHIAVVLKYDDTLPAPQVVAKGADLVAERIKAIAREHNIPIMENKPLARTIFKTIKIGQIIPRELFVAVAEVLSYVFKLKQKRWKK